MKAYFEKLDQIKKEELYLKKNEESFVIFSFYQSSKTTKRRTFLKTSNVSTILPTSGAWGKRQLQTIRVAFTFYLQIITCFCSIISVILRCAKATAIFLIRSCNFLKPVALMLMSFLIRSSLASHQTTTTKNGMQMKTTKIIHPDFFRIIVLVIRISRIAKSLIKNSNKTQGREGKQDSA